ncbi:MAG: formylmethanofuran dehydrogenase subunit C [Candidatus Ranarchaeia archaeon]
MSDSSVQLKLKKELKFALEAQSISPDLFAGKKIEEISKLSAYYGKEETKIGDFFDIKGSSGETIESTRIELTGDLSRVKFIGHGMTGGVILIKGNVGAYLGSKMEEGKIEVQGNIDDYGGVEMKGGTIIISGSAGHYTGGALPGGQIGMNGGHLIILGNSGDHLGQFMRRGVIYVEGDTGSFTGTGMDAGTIVVKGKLGERAGANMTRGNIIALNAVPEILPTFLYEGTFKLEVVRLTLKMLKDSYKIGIPDQFIGGNFIKYRGDRAEDNGKGELFLFADVNKHLLE